MHLMRPAMRRSWLARISSALLAMWFVVSIVAEPASLSGSAMSMPGMTMSGMQMASMQTPPSRPDTAQQSGVDDASTQAGRDRAPADSSDTTNCKQHDCCCSALSPSLLTPQASLAWIPEHIIDQATAYRGASVSYTEGQLLLPFANGPPKAVRG